MIEKIGMKRMIENAERLNNYMKSVDQDLKQIGEAFNTNIKLLADKIDEVSSKIDKLQKGSD